MGNGYKIFWTPNALNELEQTIEYLQNNFTDKEIKKLVHKLESVTEIISQNPKAKIFIRQSFWNSIPCIIV
ncbi:type II toxin-antitoxin system RelE/ParE family toxin [Chryseobacterium sp. CCH4-E10]|uniref:type II toxin-antitoxin system RelE/ParE family toxin n=1 Tax=Chryseobacterium sp. CCH4-E10 TaxID=1768758 RepID=UPI0008314190|nr:type II toxin-antitoxin system RelE/ParE family toxin [Chryseobacterium sp. CCH4-E10]